MRKFYFDLQIDGKPILIPDADVQVEFADLESEDSGRDEGGFMHPLFLRRGIRTWTLDYGTLTAEEYRYMEALFVGKVTFSVDYLDEHRKAARCTAYRSQHSIAIHNARLGIYRNYQFSIMEC